MLEQSIVLVIIFSIVLAFISLPSLYKYMQTASLKRSDYDILVNGLVTKSDYNQISNNEDIIEVAPVSHASGVFIYKSSDPSKKVSVQTVIIVHPETIETPSKFRLTGLEDFVISGKLKSGYPTKGYAAISWNLAKELNTDIGDKITYEVRDTKIEFEISAITVPTYETQVIVERTPNLAEHINRYFSIKESEYAGDLYIKTKNIEYTLEFLRTYSLREEKRWIILTKEELLKQISSGLKASPFYTKLQSFVVIGSLLVYFIVLLREQDIVVKRIKRNPQKKLVQIHIIEQVLVMLFVVSLASFVTRFLVYRGIFVLYLPFEVLSQGIIGGVTLNSLAIIISSSYLTRSFVEKSDSTSSSEK